MSHISPVTGIVWLYFLSDVSNLFILFIYSPIKIIIDIENIIVKILFNGDLKINFFVIEIIILLPLTIN